MTFPAWVQRHRRSILFLLAIAALAGAAASAWLPASLFPLVKFPRIVVSLDAGDRPAEQMEFEVTRPLEEAVRIVPGIVDIRSTTSRGSAEVSLNFRWGTDMVTAALQVESAIGRILPSLPAGTSFGVRWMTPAVFPVLSYSIASERRSLVELHNLVRYQIVPALSSVNGVARIGITGGKTAEYKVIVDPARLQALGLSAADVVRALSASNVLTAAGRIEDRYKLYLALTDDRFTDIDHIRRTILGTGDKGRIELEDVAEVVPGTALQWQRVTADGHDAVLFEIFQQPDGNTVQIAKEIEARLAELAPSLPADVKIGNWYDQGQLIVASIGGVRDAILIGVALAALVILAFLRNLKMMAILVVIVPAVLAAAVLVLYGAGMTFNVMTLGGMAAAVGLVIDDIVVMVETIIKRLRAHPEGHKSEIFAAARDFTIPLAGSSASTIVIFLPLAFLSGVTGGFFKALSLTIATALVISFFAAWLAVPVLADHLLRRRDAMREEAGRIAERAGVLYERALRALFRRPLLLLAGVVPLAGLGYLAYTQTGSGFLPEIDEGGFVLDYVAPPGTSLSETDRLLRQVEEIVRATPEVETFTRRTGSQLGGGLTEVNSGDVWITLKPPPRRPIDAVMDDIRERVNRDVPSLNIETSQLMEDVIGDLTAVPQPIEIKLFGDDYDTLLKLAPRVAEAITGIAGVVSVRDGIVVAGDAIDVRVDRTKAAFEGVDPEAVSQQLTQYLSGTVATTILQGVKPIDVRVIGPAALRDTVDKVAMLPIRAGDGHVFPLKRIATITLDVGQPQIVRENLRRMVAVTARISGRDLGSTVRDVARALKAPGVIPDGVSVELGGLYKQQQIAFKGMIAVFSGAVVLVFLLLLLLYERFVIALGIILMPLFALAAVFLGLWLTGVELNVSSMMGMTMIVGIVTEVAIFYFSEFRRLEPGMARRDALVAAGANRMRPIAMTTLAAIFALLPLALGIGQGSAMQQPLAIAIIAGLLVQMPLVLLVMPVLFDRLAGLRHARSATR